ncbi:hypothetical protein J3459_006106 [Metarhizium acridum]|nr:hypothetical protein J3459_006106 [Metarhizium acridum]
MASTAVAAAGTLVPAQLGFLAIFNPSLGSTDDTIDDQIVYYASDTTQGSGKRRRRTRGRSTEDISQEERHERLRQIGLAQGMINFSRGFADEASLDTVDTEKSRVITHELEPGWWILARLVRAQQAHQIHRRARPLLGPVPIYVECHASREPGAQHFGGINIAASGELGVGVGEEDRGSGEREVLEGLVGRIEGLVDLVVSKFGTEEPEDEAKTHRDRLDAQLWLGTGEEPAAEDGAVFLGTGALSRKSLRDGGGRGSGEGLFEQTEAAKETAPANADEKHQKQTGQNQTEQHKEPSIKITSNQRNSRKGRTTSIPKNNCPKTTSTRPTTQSGTPTPSETNTSKPNDTPTTSTSRPKFPKRSSSDAAHGHYLIGLKGSISEPPSDSESSSASSTHNNSRTLLRTINIELDSKSSPQPSTTIIRDFAHPASPLTQSQVAGNFLPGYTSHDLNKSEKLRVVVYVNRPFIFTFFFRLHTDSLAWDAL